MTCIVGIADGKKVWIGGDSAGVSGWSTTVRADTKVFANGPMVFGFTTSFRMGQLLRHSLQIPRHHEGDDARWLCCEFIDAVRSCLKEGGFAKTDAGVESGGSFLVGYRGRLYEIGSDYQVGEPAGQWAAVGCGEDFALGSLHGSTGDADRRVRLALTAAADLSAGVREPFHVVVGGEA